MFVRSIFNEPINGVAYQATWRALMKDESITDAIVEKYPPMCQDENLEQNQDALDSCVARICDLIGICENVTDSKISENFRAPHLALFILTPRFIKLVKSVSRYDRFQSQ